MDMTSKKREKQKAILDSAFSLFMSRGYSCVKVIEIAKKAGIGKGTIYEYFKSKDDILIAIINTTVRDEFMSLDKNIEKEDTFHGKLLTLIDFELDFMKRYGPHAPEMKRYLIGPGNLRFSEELLSAIRELVSLEYSSIASLIEFGIKEGSVNPKIDNVMAIHFISSTIASFAAIAQDTSELLPFLNAVGSDTHIKRFSAEDVYNIIINGIH